MGVCMYVCTPAYTNKQMMISAFADLHRQQRLDMQKVIIMLRTGSLIVVRHNVDVVRTWSGALVVWAVPFSMERVIGGAT